MNWLMKVFGSFKRTEAAADKMADEMEGLASDLAKVRQGFRERVGLDRKGVLVLEDKRKAR